MSLEMESHCPSLYSMVLFSLTLYLQEWPHGVKMAAEAPTITTAFKGRNCGWAGVGVWARREPSHPFHLL